MQKLVPSNPNLGRKQGNFLFVEIRTPPPEENVHSKCAYLELVFLLLTQPNLINLTARQGLGAIFVITYLVVRGLMVP